MLGEIPHSFTIGYWPTLSSLITRLHASTRRCPVPFCSSLSLVCACSSSLSVCVSQVDVIKYTDEEYRAHLDGDKSWNKEQTDRLFEAARRFDLRWPVIADRLDLGNAHPLPDIKNRFYSVTAKIIAARRGHPSVQLMKSYADFVFNPEQDRKVSVTALDGNGRDVSVHICFRSAANISTRPFSKTRKS